MLILGMAWSFWTIVYIQLTTFFLKNIYNISFLFFSSNDLLCINLSFTFFLSLIFFFVPIVIISYYVSSYFSFPPLFSHCLILKSPLPFVSFLSFFIVIYFLFTSDHTYLLFFSFFLSCSFSSDSKLDHFISHCKRKHPSGQDQWPWLNVCR